MNDDLQYGMSGHHPVEATTDQRALAEVERLLGERLQGPLEFGFPPFRVGDPFECRFLPVEIDVGSDDLKQGVVPLHEMGAKHVVPLNDRLQRFPQDLGIESHRRPQRCRQVVGRAVVLDLIDEPKRFLGEGGRSCSPDSVPDRPGGLDGAGKRLSGRRLPAHRLTRRASP
jgi:hypothetical protein